MPTPREEVTQIVEAAGLGHGPIAAFLTQTLGRVVKPYVIGRILSGERAVSADEMDAFRRLLQAPAGVGESVVAFTPQLTEHSDRVPLYSATGRSGGKLRLSEEYRVGVTAIHPSQKGYRSAFSFIQPDDKLGDLLRKGHIGHVVRDLPPVPGLPCLVEREDGEAYARIYVGEDTNTLFLKALKPKEAEERVPLREVKACNRIVGVTYGPA